MVTLVVWHCRHEPSELLNSQLPHARARTLAGARVTRWARADLCPPSGWNREEDLKCYGVFMFATSTVLCVCVLYLAATVLCGCVAECQAWLAVALKTTDATSIDAEHLQHCGFVVFPSLKSYFEHILTLAHVLSGTCEATCLVAMGCRCVLGQILRDNVCVCVRVPEGYCRLGLDNSRVVV